MRGWRDAVYRLPMRDGNPSELTLAGEREPVYRLPMRDGNCTASMSVDADRLWFIDYL